MRKIKVNNLACNQNVDQINKQTQKRVTGGFDKESQYLLNILEENQGYIKPLCLNSSCSKIEVVIDRGNNIFHNNIS